MNQIKPLRRRRGAVAIPFAGLFGLASFAGAAVPAADITLQAPVTDNLPVITTISAYSATEATVTQPNKQTPLFAPYNNREDTWWDNLVSEHLQARLPVVMLTSCGLRGDAPVNPADLGGPGDMNPYRLQNYIRALHRAGGTGRIKFGLFAQTDAQSIYRNYYGLPSTAKCNFANEDSWNEVWWKRIIKPWLDTVPQSSWYLINNRLPIEFWGLGINSLYENQQGNVSRMLKFVDDQMWANYGTRACFIMGDVNYDTTLATEPSVMGNNMWWSPPSIAYTMTNYKGAIWGGIAAGYIDPGYFDPGSPKYQDPNRRVRRNGVNGLGQNGDTFRAGLNAAFSNKAKLSIIEGWINVSESNGLYRQEGDPEWDYPNQYINILREYTDLRTVTLRLEAEAADTYYDTTPGNSGGAFRRSPANLDIRPLSGAPAITASAENAPFQYAKDAFDGVLSSKWYTPSAAPGWIQYDYGTGNQDIVTGYHLCNTEFALATALARSPKDWTLQASGNGTTWVTLDTRTNQTWTDRNETKSFTFANSTAYRYYRLNVSAVQGGGSNGIAIAELRLISNSSNGGGWAVTDTAAGEWIEFKNVYFSDGNYKFPIRYSATSARTMRLSIDGVALPDVTVPSTGSMGIFDTISLGTATVSHGTHTLRVTFVNGGADLDWLFVKKSDRFIGLQGDNGSYLCAEKGGDDVFVVNRASIGSWEKFSANDLNGGTLNANDTLTLQAWNGLYVSPAGGGGAGLVSEVDPTANERFTIVKTNGATGALLAGDSVALRTNGGQYLTRGSGNTLTAAGTSIGAAQTFTLHFRDQ